MPSDISSKNEVYENLQYNFKINYPKGWKINEKGEFGSIVVFLILILIKRIVIF